jgi:1-acyl-sn-glycerol-3-phosphate acyltransferase
MRAVSDPPPALFSRLTLGFLLWVYRRKGWQIEGAPPETRRFVITGAPHTSNWDFVFFAGVTHALGIRPRFMGKLSLFRWPLRRFMFDMGGVPVDRSARGDYTAAMITEFARRDEFALVVAPEGTRRSVKGWRSGFYHIALGAGVPIVPAWVDNQGLRGGLGPPIMPSGDYSADLALIAEFYLSRMPGHPKVLALAAQVAALKEVGND